MNVAEIDILGIKKKLYKLSKFGGGQEGINLYKTQKNSSFFRETFPKTPSEKVSCLEEPWACTVIVHEK